MTSVNPPEYNFPGINYNSSFWTTNPNAGLTYNDALKKFLSFPVAQGTETLQNTNVNGTLTIINPLTPSETYSQYIDNDPSLDMTLSTAQTAGGLTIRTPTNSFTMQPNTFNINLTTPTSVTGMQLLNPINMANFNIVNMGQYSTAYTQALNTHEDYVATCNYVNDMIVNGGGILDNANDWTNTNTFESYLNVGTVTASNYYSQISQIANGALNINNQTPSANFPNTNFKCNNGSNVMTTYLSIAPQEIDSFTTLNMNTQVINNCSALNGSLGGTLLLGTQQTSYITITGGSLSAGNSLGISSTNGIFVFNYYTANNLSLNMSGTAQTFYIQNSNGNIMTFSETEIDANKNLNMNNFSLLNIGQNSTAYTQAQGTSNTSIATTQFVTQNTAISKNSVMSSVYSTDIAITSGTAQTSILFGEWVQFQSKPFTLNILASTLPTTTLVALSFNVTPWSSYPSSTTGTIVGLCTNNGSTYSFNYVWSSGGPVFIISYPTGSGAPKTAGYNFTFNLASIGLFFG
jgi:hypothetical protein